MYAKVKNGGERAAWLRSRYQHVCKAIPHSVPVASAYKEMNNLVLSFGVIPPGGRRESMVIANPA